MQCNNVILHNSILLYQNYLECFFVQHEKKMLYILLVSQDKKMSTIACFECQNQINRVCNSYLRDTKKWLVFFST